MSEINYRLSCEKCGKSIKVHLKLGLGDFGKFKEEDLPKQLNAICSCKKDKK